MNRCTYSDEILNIEKSLELLFSLTELMNMAGFRKCEVFMLEQMLNYFV
jgi:hypothetical protein